MSKKMRIIHNIIITMSFLMILLSLFSLIILFENENENINYDNFLLLFLFTSIGLFCVSVGKLLLSDWINKKLQLMEEQQKQKQKNVKLIDVTFCAKLELDNKKNFENIVIYCNNPNFIRRFNGTYLGHLGRENWRYYYNKDENTIIHIPKSEKIIVESEVI